MIEDMSTPMTCLAPARAANLCAIRPRHAPKVFDLRIHAQNASAAADIEDNLVLEEMAVLVDGVAIRTGANIVFLKAGRQVVSNFVNVLDVIR